jgi:ATP-dependent DNA helicase DinG
MIAVIFDTETTGLIQNHSMSLNQQPEVIEFYAAQVELETGKIIREYDTLIKPSRKLSDVPAFGDKKTITQMTGITNEMLEDQPSFKDVADNIRSILLQGEYVIAHNVSFDCEMIDIEYERLKQSLMWPEVICTVEASAYLNGGRLSLTKLHEYLFGTQFKDAHRAKPDCQALIRCTLELFKRGAI